MSIDKEIAEIRLALRNLHELLYRITLKMNNATNIVDNELNSFDQSVRNVANEVNHIKDNTNLVTSLFPSNTTYVVSLLVLDGVIWVLAFLLLYLIVQRLKERHINSQKWQEKYRLLVTSFRTPLGQPAAAIIINDDVENGQVRLVSKDMPYPYEKYRSNIRQPPPYPYRYKDDESESLLKEIPPENRQKWTTID